MESTYSAENVDKVTKSEEIAEKNWTGSVLNVEKQEFLRMFVGLFQRPNEFKWKLNGRKCCL